MSGLVVLALLGVAWGFIRQAHVLMAARAQRTEVAVPVRPMPQGAAATITLAPGARIVSTSTDAGKLVLHVQTPAGAEIDIIDLATGRLVSQVKAAP